MFRKHVGLLIFLLFIVNIILLNGCSTAGRPPQGVDEDIYGKTVAYLKFISEKRDKLNNMSEQEQDEILCFIIETSKMPTTTAEEKEILSKLLDVIGSYAFLIHYENEKNIDAYEKAVKELKELLNLR